MEIRYVKNGIANNYGDYIELNENLVKYPQLHKSIIQHELKHTKDSGFTKQDLIVDMGESKIDNVALLKFMFKYPRSFWQLSPIYIKDKTFYYDINMFLTWGLSLGLIGLTLYFAFK